MYGQFSHHPQYNHHHDNGSSDLSTSRYRLVGPEVILADANDLTCPGAFIDRVMCDLCIIVTSINLEVLCGIEAHHADLI